MFEGVEVAKSTTEEFPPSLIILAICSPHQQEIGNNLILQLLLEHEIGDINMSNNKGTNFMYIRTWSLLATKEHETSIAARCHHNPNSSLNSFHILRKVFICRHIYVDCIYQISNVMTSFGWSFMLLWQLVSFCYIHTVIYSMPCSVKKRCCESNNICNFEYCIHYCITYYSYVFKVAMMMLKIIHHM